MLPLETKQSGGKLLPHSDLRWGVFLGEALHGIQREIKLGAGPGQGQVADACECGNEPSGSIKCGEVSWLAANQLASQEGLCTME